MQIHGTPRLQRLLRLAEREDISVQDVRDCGCGLDRVSRGHLGDSGLYSAKQFRSPEHVPGQRLERPVPQPPIPLRKPAGSKPAPLPPVRPKELGAGSSVKPQSQPPGAAPQPKLQPPSRPQPDLPGAQPQPASEDSPKPSPAGQARPKPSQPPRGPQNSKQQGLAILAQSKAANGQMVSVEEGLKTVTPAARRHLQKLPPEMQKVFVNLSSQELKWMHNRLNGSTQMGFFTIHHREAFISGRALGQDVYQYAINGLKKQIAQGALPQEMEGRLTRMILQVKALTVEQRTSLMDALDAQVRR